MNKRLFVVLVILMSLSLIGIIFVQGYWIASAVKVKQESFTLNANQILANVSERVSDSEDRRYYLKFQELIDSFYQSNNRRRLQYFSYVH
jgi:two-component system phosphate regulon sensor histidine kinase PhoR